MSEDANEIQPQSSPKGAAKVRLLTLDSLDRRTAAAQAALALRDRLLAERGGPDRLSALQVAIVESTAVLSTMIQDALVRWIKGEPVDVAGLATLINARRREAEKVGIQLEPLDITPTTAAQRIMGEPR